VLALLSRRIRAPRDRALVGQVLPIDGPTLPFEEAASVRVETPAPGASRQRRRRAGRGKARDAKPAPVDAAEAPVMVPKLPAPLEASLLALLEEEPEQKAATPDR
jgi:hypothetical protein